MVNKHTKCFQKTKIPKGCSSAGLSGSKIEGVLRKQSRREKKRENTIQIYSAASWLWFCGSVASSYILFVE